MEQNQDIALRIKDILETLSEAVIQLQTWLAEGKVQEFAGLVEDMRQALAGIREKSDCLQEDYYKELEKTAQNCQVSLERIFGYSRYNRDKAMHKIEYELFPLLRLAYTRFYFFSMIYPDKEKMKEWYKTEGFELCKNYYVDEAERTGKYPYDISIIVVGYNKLEYTKMCVENIIRNLPENLRCELILVNNGSSDGTKEYFESIHPNKQIDLAVNSGNIMINIMICEGEYVLAVSNDVIMTPHSIDIMYEAMKKNEKIACVAPMTSNVSNLQMPQANNINKTIEVNDYQNIQELDEYALKVNIRDAGKEEIRFRLCNPLAMYKASHHVNSKSAMTNVMLMTMGSYQMFPDDLISMRFRHAGLYSVLMKDVYCHHFGSVTLRNEKIENKDYNAGRKRFLDMWGIDPWGKGFCWSYDLFSNLICDKKDAEQILGINCGMGSNILKIQQDLKENTENKKVRMYNYTNRERYQQELLGFSDKVYLHHGWEDVKSRLKSIYDYILVEEEIEENYSEIIPLLYQATAPGGKLIILFQSHCVELENWVRHKYKGRVLITGNVELTYDMDSPAEDRTERYGKYAVISRK